MSEVRLIDANALMEKVCGNCQQKDCVPDATDTVYGCMFAESVEEANTIEAEPVRHGRWIEDGEICGIDKYKCSLCGGEVGGLLDNTKYCCFCGAKMDGGVDNATD